MGKNNYIIIVIFIRLPIKKIISKMCYLVSDAAASLVRSHHTVILLSVPYLTRLHVKSNSRSTLTDTVPQTGREELERRLELLQILIWSGKSISTKQSTN